MSKTLAEQKAEWLKQAIEEAQANIKSIPALWEDLQGKAAVIKEVAKATGAEIPKEITEFLPPWHKHLDGEIRAETRIYDHLKAFGPTGLAELLNIPNPTTKSDDVWRGKIKHSLKTRTQGTKDAEGKPICKVPWFTFDANTSKYSLLD
jgi:hypothetical protein